MNLPDDFDETNNLNTYAKLQEAILHANAMPAVASATPKTDNQYSLVMYAEDTKMIKKSLDTGMAFTMQRLAARIDITNRAFDQDFPEKGFVLTSAYRYRHLHVRSCEPLRYGLCDRSRTR